MQTSDPDIYAVGDVVEIRDFVTEQPTQVPLAGPANRQGRLAADHIFGRPVRYRGTQGTAVVGVFDMTAAMTGASEKALRRANRPFRKVFVHPANHAGYYPGAEAMTIKLLFDPRNPRQLRASVEESLRLLGRDVIDLLFVHEPDRPLQYDWWSDPDAVDGPVVEVLDQLKKRGIIRHTGLGGTTCAEMAHCIRSNRFDAVLTAFNYSALFREATHEVIPAARERNMAIVLGSALQQGGLGRRYDDVVRQKPAWLSRPRQQQLLAFYQFLDETGIPIVEMGLRFALSNPAIGTLLIGPKTASQVEESVAIAAKGPLPADVLGRLDAIAALVPFRPFEEPMILPLARPRDYNGPGMANIGSGAKVGKL